MIRADLIVHGLVQGVGYRRFAEKRAHQLGVTGSAKNCANGTVECTAEGSRPDVEKFIEELKKGPLFSRVKAIDVVWKAFSGEFTSFTIDF